MSNINIKIKIGNEQILSIKLTSPSEIEVNVEGEGTPQAKNKGKSPEKIVVKKEVIPNIPEPEIETSEEENHKKDATDNIIRSVAEESPTLKEKSIEDEYIDNKITEYFNENNKVDNIIKKGEKKKEESEKNKDIDANLNELLGIS